MVGKGCNIWGEGRKLEAQIKPVCEVTSYTQGLLDPQKKESDPDLTVMDPRDHRSLILKSQKGFESWITDRGDSQRDKMQ